MCKTGIVICFLFGVFGQAQSGAPPFSIQGHEIGETLDSYLQRVPFSLYLDLHKPNNSRKISGIQLLEDCRSIPKRKLRGFIPDSQKQLCLELIAAVDDGGPFNAGTQEVRKFQLRTPQDPFSYVFLLPSSYVTFVGGKLIEIDAEVLHTYPEVLLDVTTRLGAPTETSEVASQNSYGATFRNPHTVWVGPALAVELNGSTQVEGGLHQVVRIKVSPAGTYIDGLQTKHIDTLK
jgi:hypothetical protein